MYPDNKVHGVNLGPIWSRQDPGGPHVGPMNFALWVLLYQIGLRYIESLYQYSNRHSDLCSEILKSIADTCT